MKKSGQDPPQGGNDTYTLTVTQTLAGEAGRMQRSQNTVLVVDDDADLRESLADVLRDEGYAVSMAANGQEALDLLPKLKRPCGVVLDMAMPVMDGTQFYQAMRAVPALADIPVVVFSCDPSWAPSGLPKIRKTNLERVLTLVAELF